MTHRLTPKPIHPFPARMAPEIALNQVRELPRGAVILDPMAGSGTVLRVASDYHHPCLGFDTDPLAVLMAKVWNTPIDTTVLRKTAREIVQNVIDMTDSEVVLDWIDNDEETRKYVDFWFADTQRLMMRRIASRLIGLSDTLGDALKVALSRIIITKNKGASLAKDVSHSRPHRRDDPNDFDVLQGFIASIEKLACRLERHQPHGTAEICLGDARQLIIPSASVDAVITSPPYLNAIDYLRGHRLSLVWLGYSVRAISVIRSKNIGAERFPDPESDLMFVQQTIESIGTIDQLPKRNQHIITRYVLDLYKMLSEVYRVLKSQGRAVFVVGNSCVKDVFVRNDGAVHSIAEQLGFQLVSRSTREIPPSRRYLPPPQGHQVGRNMEKRMRTETVLTYQRA